MSTMRIDVVGIPWYSREQYHHVVAIMKDGASLPHSYEEWHDSALTATEQLRERGIAVIPADISPKAFLVWCRRLHQHPDATGRRAFATALAMASVCPHAGNA